MEIAPKKDLNSVFVESGLLEFKCKQNADGDYTFIYLLGASEANPAIKYNDEIIYGRVTYCSNIASDRQGLAFDPFGRFLRTQRENDYV